MKQFILQYWLEVIFGAIASIAVLNCKRLRGRITRKRAEQEALKAGMVAILHDRLFQLCNNYLALGYIPVDKSEEILDNINIIYNAYHCLGGNGTGTDIYNKFKKLHVRRGE